MKSGKSQMNQDEKKILLPQDKLIILLSFHKDFSKVMTLSSLIEQIASINNIFKKNFLSLSYLINKKNRNNEISLYNNNNPQKVSNDFFSFLSKAIICFPSKDNYSYDFFMSQIKNVASVILILNQLY